MTRVSLKLSQMDEEPLEGYKQALYSDLQKCCSISSENERNEILRCKENSNSESIQKIVDELVLVHRNSKILLKLFPKIPDYEFTFSILNPQVINYNQPFVDFRIRLSRAAVMAAVLSKIILSIQFSKYEILNSCIFIRLFRLQNYQRKERWRAE